MGSVLLMRRSAWLPEPRSSIRARWRLVLGAVAAPRAVSCQRYDDESRDATLQVPFGSFGPQRCDLVASRFSKLGMNASNQQSDLTRVSVVCLRVCSKVLRMH
eukprot:CAMPEP_0185850640 /NCGR_PEP_ID=MMETSP1354-20130828/4703_1 /TAXON_ID=708628 /ORGANISM="Erythrolobus madagascarensis, Strain CCMP3276" /LENGTH=102 /DNA_ID=CAMNT_0028551345 /DNA_START=321 /DNA_END=629 /DNA_ORIENTATION=+